MSLKSTTITLKVEGGEEKALGTGSTKASFPGENPLYQQRFALSDGSGSNHAQKIGLASYSLSGGASVTFDLTAFPGPFGNVNFSLIRHWGGDQAGGQAADVLEIGDDGTVTNPWLSPFGGTNGSRIKLGPGGAFSITAPGMTGFAVAGGNKNLKIKNTNSGTNVVNGNLLAIGEGT